MTTFILAAFGAFIGPFFTRVVDLIFARFNKKSSSLDMYLVEALDDLELLLKDCEDFWGADAQALGNRNHVLQARIAARTNSLKQKIQKLFADTNWELRNSQSEWSEIYRSATGGKFDDLDRVADGAKLTVILRTGWELKSNLPIRRAKI